MNFSEELAVAGELELTDSELEMVLGGMPTKMKPPHMGDDDGFRRRFRRGFGGYDDDFGGYWGEPEYPPIPLWLLLELEGQQYRRY
jgi:hypothetical protein